MNETTQPAVAGPVEPTVRQHTPGPWMWDSDPVKGDPLNRVRFRVVARGKTVTQCYYSSSDEQAAHDARLIAAAPELLAALDKINEWCPYATKEDTAARLMALQQIGVLARDAMARAA